MNRRGIVPAADIVAEVRRNGGDRHPAGVTCGDKAATLTGVSRHRRAAERLCAACAEANRNANAASYKARNGQAAGGTP